MTLSTGKITKPYWVKEKDWLKLKPNEKLWLFHRSIHSQEKDIAKSLGYDHKGRAWRYFQTKVRNKLFNGKTY